MYHYDDEKVDTTAYWIAAAIILVLLVIGVALWYSATTTNRDVYQSVPAQE